MQILTGMDSVPLAHSQAPVSTAPSSTWHSRCPPSFRAGLPDRRAASQPQHGGYWSGSPLPREGCAKRLAAPQVSVGIQLCSALSKAKEHQRLQLQEFTCPVHPAPHTVPEAKGCLVKGGQVRHYLNISGCS